MEAKQAPVPDPVKVSTAEGQSNIGTALTQGVLGNPNTFGPGGSTTYAPSGQFTTVTMPDGSKQQIERQNATTQLSDGEQGVYDSNLQTRQNIGQVGVDQSRMIGDVLGKPVDYSGLGLDPNSFAAARQNVEQAMYQRMQPQMDNQRDAARNRATNMGIAEGSEAWNTAMDDVNRGENDLRLGITAAGLGEQQGMYGMARDAAGYEMSRRTQQQNQPINALTALMSGSQVSGPSVPGYNAPTVAPTNIGQNMYNSAALTAQNVQQQNAANNAMIGGLFGMGGAAIGMPQIQKKLWG